MTDVNTTSVPAGNVVYVQHVQRETTQGPKLPEELPYRAKLRKGTTDSWYHKDAPDSDESDVIPGGGDDTDLGV